MIERAYQDLHTEPARLTYTYGDGPCRARPRATIDAYAGDGLFSPYMETHCPTSTEVTQISDGALLVTTSFTYSDDGDVLRLEQVDNETGRRYVEVDTYDRVGNRLTRSFGWDGEVATRQSLSYDCWVD
jgi:hypothetical protein